MTLRLFPLSVVLLGMFADSRFWHFVKIETDRPISWPRVDKKSPPRSTLPERPDP